MTCRLVSLEMESFRGFRDARQLDLDADIILVRGDNGTGKTSLTDGILWVLTGELPHISERLRGVRQTHDPLQNRYSDRASRVALTVRDSSSTWTFERAGNARTNALRATRDGDVVDAAEWMPSVFGEDDIAALRLAVTTWGVLRQDAVRSVLDTGGAALHERMASVIGLSEVSRFQEACRSMTKRAAASRLHAKSARDTAQEGLEAARDALASHDSVRQNDADGSGALVDRVRAAIAPTEQDLFVDASGIETLAELVTFGQQVAELRDLAVAAADTFDEYVRASADVIETSERLTQEVERADSQAIALGHATTEMQRLAEVALELLGDDCPVCDRPIDQNAVRHKLQLELERNSQRLLAASEARSLAESIRQRLDVARLNERRQAQSLSALDGRMRALTEALSLSVIVRRQNRDLRFESVRPLARRLENLVTSLRQIHSELRAQVEVATSRLIAAVDAAAVELGEMDAALRSAIARERTSKSLEDKTQAATDHIVAKWLTDLEPSFAEVFDRLTPHPTFSRLRARQDVYYRKNQVVPEVIDPLRDVSANPLLVYSEGQLNTVAISYFLGLALNAPTTGLGFMVMDDPLQSMDVLAVLGFADLCRRLRRQRQLVVTTHDRRYADLLGRKLAPREGGDRTISHEFENWSAQGPQVTTVHDDFATAPTVLTRTAG